MRDLGSTVRRFLWLWLVGLLLLLGWLWIVLKATVFRAGAAVPKPKEVWMTVPGYPVGEFKEPPVAILTQVNGKTTIRLKRLDDPTQTLEAPVEALKLVDIFSRQTKLGICTGKTALRIGKTRPRNRRYYFNARIACAAYTAAILRHCGRPGGSFSASAQYAQLRRRGAKVVSTKMSTRYNPYQAYLKSGDFIFYHKAGGRIGHVEIYVGSGKVSGTSSSAGYVAIRRIGNRGFARCSVLRL